MRTYTFNEVDEQIRFIEIVREAKVKPAERYVAVAADAGRAALLWSRRDGNGPRTAAAAVHLLLVVTRLLMLMLDSRV